MRAPEFAFVTPATLLVAGQAAFSPSLAAGARTLAPVFALGALGYDARAFSLAAERLDTAAIAGAKAVVFGDPGAALLPYQELLASLSPEKILVFDLHELPDGQALELCREALRRGAGLTASAEPLALQASRLLGCAVRYVPDALEGPAGEPRAMRVKPRSRPLEWLARRAGLATESWRTRLLWSGEQADLDTIVNAYPGLQRVGRERPLELACLAPQAALEALADRLREDDPDALRLALQTRSPAAMAQALAACDLVLLPREPARLMAAVHAGRLALARPGEAYGALGEAAWLGEDPADGIRWALTHPREALERLRRGRQLLDRIHAPAAVAQAWLRILMKGPR